jgi:hypothetical protein
MLFVNWDGTGWMERTGMVVPCTPLRQHPQSLIAISSLLVGANTAY